MRGKNGWVVCGMQMKSWHNKDDWILFFEQGENKTKIDGECKNEEGEAKKKSRK